MINNPTSLTLVAGVDFSESSALVLARAIELASAFEGSRLYLLHASKEADLAKLAVEIEQLKASAVGALKTTPRRAAFRVVSHLVMGPPAQEIVRFAAHVDADYVVVGAGAHGRLRNLLVGSTAQRVLLAAGCPVILVRPRDHDLSDAVPEVEAPCADCVSARKASLGAKIWCARHAEHHPRAHFQTYDTEPSVEPVRAWGFGSD